MSEHDSSTGSPQADVIISGAFIAAARAEFTTMAKAYFLTADLDRRREIAACMIAQMASIVDKVGFFENISERPRTPIITLLNMITDLNKGRDHAWARPSRYGGSSADSAAKREVKLWVLAAVRVLRDSGHGANEAYRLVAEVLTKSGFMGRQSGTAGTFPQGTVKRWWNEYVNAPGSAHERVESTARNYWEMVRCSHADTPINCSADDGKPCLPVKVIGQRFIEEAGLLGLLGERFRSATFG